MPISATETSTSGLLARNARSASTTIAAPALENVADPEAAGGEIGDRVELELGDGELLEDAAGTSCQRAAGLRQPQRPQPTVDERRPHLRSSPATIFETAGCV